MLSVKAYQDRSKLLDALRHIARLVDRADECVDFVDNPYQKALRAASKVAQDAIKESANGG